MLSKGKELVVGNHPDFRQEIDIMNHEEYIVG